MSMHARLSESAPQISAMNLIMSQIEFFLYLNLILLEIEKHM